MPPTPRQSVRNRIFSPSHAKITGQDESCRCVSGITWTSPGFKCDSVCKTPSDQSIETKSTSFAPPSPMEIGWRFCPGPAELRTAPVIVHRPPTFAATVAPIPLALLRMDCPGSVRPASVMSTNGKRPLPAGTCAGAASAPAISIIGPVPGFPCTSVHEWSPSKDCSTVPSPPSTSSTGGAPI